jgi:uncharacterized protein (UPF0335 family)
LEEIKKELELDWSDISYVVNQVDVKWLIKRIEELEKENRELNMEIGTYSSKIDEIQRSIGVKLADLKILSTQMLKGDSK